MNGADDSEVQEIIQQPIGQKKKLVKGQGTRSRYVQRNKITRVNWAVGEKNAMLVKVRLASCVRISFMVFV
jgi:hypothetical protein